MATMRAVIQDRYGAPEILREAVIDRPVPAAGEVLVRVSAASVNGYDVLLRSGALRMVTGRKFPKQSGLDFVGTVAEAFHGSPFQVGDDMWGVLPLHRSGSLADYVAIAPNNLAARPARLTVIEAAALPVVGATALAALRDIIALLPGEHLLVRGASGGVGSVAVQLGKAMGAHVTGLASTHNLAFVKEVGADQAFDYAKIGPADLGLFDAIIDTVGTEIASYRRLLARGGRMAAIVPDPRRPLLWMAYVALSRLHGGRRVRFLSAAPDTALLAALGRFVEERAVTPQVGAVCPIARIADAHRAFEVRGSRGKQIITLD